ncbi:hypothetical protein [Ruegeria sp. HKCCD7255]|uniref:hypothetical protein n=1 Tax=Ruegeria sp. HKCCD7255 TaxID=2683004 RepID=UPI001487DC4D|nr:hypothetical protein [Ruegeria sp. HKCCD7255]
MITSEFKLFADFFQFLVQDEWSAGVDGDLWTEDAMRARLARGVDAFAVRTARNMHVPVEVLVNNKPPKLDLSSWDHVVELSIDLPSGRLVVAGCSDYLPEAERLVLDKGHYQARVLYSNLDSVYSDGLDGDDRYRVELWKGDAKPLKVLKEFVV